jgi:hypothetical protein|uniref:hypothetical protein n=1 Tax=Flavobacterium sp. TaxID=239 RepID=UPI004049AE39
MTNNDNVDKLKSALHAASVEWNPLFENGVKTKPYYFGIYKTVYKPGFQASEKLYSKRLQHLVNYLEKVKVSTQRAQQYIDKIISYHKAFNNTVDFNSEAFRNGCRDLMKPLRHLTRYRIDNTNRKVLVEPLVSDGDRKVLAKYCYQLNPYNYSYPYLTHFYYVTEEGITTLLINDNRRKQARRLDAIGELMAYISRLEMPRRKHRTALSYRYLIFENNPGKICNETIVYGAVNFAVMAGSGTQDAWQKNAKGVWKLSQTFDHWRR